MLMAAARVPPDADGATVDLVNLWRGPFYRIGGDCIYGLTHEGRNKRAAVLRLKPAAYDVKKRKHVRLEPAGLQRLVHVRDEKQIHYKWANWPRWENSPQSASGKYAAYLKGNRPTLMDESWLWLWDADEWARALPQPVAVVGNGANINAGREIDAHAYVIRLNNWQTFGFEDRVGRRTDCWATSAHDNIVRRPWTRDMVFPFCQNAQHNAGHNVGVWLGEYPHARWPRESWQDEAIALTRRPSTGLTLLVGLARAGVTVDAYGFDGMTTGHYWQTDHVHGHESEADALRKLPPSIRFR
jgi:hypothetical protein